MDCLHVLDQAATVRDLTGPVGNGGWLRFTGCDCPSSTPPA